MWAAFTNWQSSFPVLWLMKLARLTAFVPNHLWYQQTSGWEWDCGCSHTGEGDCNVFQIFCNSVLIIVISEYTHPGDWVVKPVLEDLGPLPYCPPCQRAHWGWHFCAPQEPCKWWLKGSAGKAPKNLIIGSICELADMAENMAEVLKHQPINSSTRVIPKLPPLKPSRNSHCSCLHQWECALQRNFKNNKKKIA